jgi:hypothetical protein
MNRTRGVNRFGRLAMAGTVLAISQLLAVTRWAIRRW